MITDILLILVVILYFPFIFILLSWGPLMLICRYYKYRTKTNKILGGGCLLVNKITRGGVMRYTMFKIARFPSIAIRTIFYKSFGASIAKNVVFHFGTEIRAPWGLKVGKGTIIGDNNILDARNGIVMGENVSLSSNVSIYTRQHNHRSPNYDCDFPGRKQNVEIQDRVWLGSNVVVLPGVSIGEGAVICAGAVVTKDVNPYEVVAGIPAKKVGERPRNLVYEFDGKTCWFY